MESLWALFGLGPTELIILAILGLGSAVPLLIALAIVFIVLRKKRDSKDE